MPERVGRMISVEVGVADVAAGEALAELLMGKASPRPGSERAVTSGSTLSYLRIFSVENPAASSGPAAWVNFGIRFESNAEAGPIVSWLFDTLTKFKHPLTLRVDTLEIALEMDTMTRLIGRKVEKSM